MPAHPFLCRLAAALPAALLLCACRKEVPTPPVPPAEPTPKVAPSTDLLGASDHPQAAPAVGAMTAGQAGGGARGGAAMQPSGGDGTRAASAASATAPP